MAIDDKPDIRCWSTRHRPQDAPSAVAVVRTERANVNAWSPRCQPCVDQLAALADYLVLVAHLDPARVRGADTDQPTDRADQFNPVANPYWH